MFDTIPACSRCGKCCQAELCVVGEMAFGESPPPCPALKMVNGIAFCAFLEAEREFRLERVFAQTLGVGVGCTERK
jgi:hypothetical protein